jgi:hypothetical protein
MKRPNWLITLLERGSVGYSSANPNILNELLHLGLIRIRSAGIKRSVAVADLPQLAQWVNANYPEHKIDPDALPKREGNIVRSGSSKVGKSSHETLPFVFKWFGSEFDLWSRLTREYGVAAVLSDSLASLVLPTQWRLLTIENWEPFFRANYTGVSVPTMVAYLSGNASDTVLNALETFSHPPKDVLHFGDYDWEGLYIFQRLQRTLPSARLYIPENVEVLFKKFGDRKLVEKQKLKSGFNLEDRECLPVVRLIQETNYGLEQEIVDLPKMD